ncbi:PhoPQ-activated pathogenicity-related family protein [Limnoglobus roseus]|uniref:Phenylacetic acid degradation protein n=1 Tax=Limnoglobus roseus TaxID=2598579 RepID=A0A5C1AD95_9BACT|nr:PhoPQ-activated protein PqaA family protein [Limnoglobus roseus]QEL17271.1 hypothetical protein PX52LOC_04254 [Limnoglobus roseus]
MSRFLSLAFVAVVASTTVAQTPQIPPDLENYVKKSEPDFAWKLVDKSESEGNAILLYHLVSQKWHDELWEHDLQIFVPKEVNNKSAMVLLNTGGKANKESVTGLIGLELARRVKAPVAVLWGIPKQPLYDGKKEDALIAETFVRYLETKDSSWPLLFPMAKSVVKAMDALQEIGRKEWNTEVKDFIITGASKRGWTSWLTAATGDPRVKAIAPMVIDTLNFQKQMPNQLKSFGRYSEMIHDYEERKLLPMPDTDAARKLWAMVDPWVYRDKLTLPKLLVNGTNDPYWAQDALNQYWDDLKGDKWVVYVPNAGHDLRPQDKPNQPGAKKDTFPMKAVDTISVFCRCVLTDKPLPKMTWKQDIKNGDGVFSLRPDRETKIVRLWTTESDTRDFRKSAWKKKDIFGGTAKVSVGPAIGGTVTAPEAGFRAYFLEAESKIDGTVACFSTTIQILEAKK